MSPRADEQSGDLARARAFDPDSQLGVRRAVMWYGAGVLCMGWLLSGPHYAMPDWLTLLIALAVLGGGPLSWVMVTRWFFQVWPNGVHGHGSASQRFAARELQRPEDAELRGRVNAAEFSSGLAGLTSLQWNGLLFVLLLNGHSYGVSYYSSWRFPWALPLSFDWTSALLLGALVTLGSSAFLSIHAFGGSRFSWRRLMAAHVVGAIGGALLLAPFAPDTFDHINAGHTTVLAWVAFVATPFALHIFTIAHFGPMLRHLDQRDYRPFVVEEDPGSTVPPPLA